MQTELLTNVDAGDESDHQDPEPVTTPDLRILWGPELCRLEYLLHLLTTGRIHDN